MKVRKIGISIGIFEIVICFLLFLARRAKYSIILDVKKLEDSDLSLHYGLV